MKYIVGIACIISSFYMSLGVFMSIRFVREGTAGERIKFVAFAFGTIFLFIYGLYSLGRNSFKNK